MLDYQLVYLADQEYKERIRGPYRGHIYTPEMPSLADLVNQSAARVRHLLAWAAGTVVFYQGQRAPIGRRLASKRS